jgi:hypothetical protein
MDSEKAANGPSKGQECKKVSDFNLLEIKSERRGSEARSEADQEMAENNEPKIKITERPGKQSVKLSKSNALKLLESSKNVQKHPESPESGDLNVVGKCPSTISSYVGGFLVTAKNG